MVNISSLLYPFFHLSFRQDHEQFVGRMLMTLYTSPDPERQCLMFTIQSRNGHTRRVQIELFLNQADLRKATFGVLVRKALSTLLCSS